MSACASRFVVSGTKVRTQTLWFWEQVHGWQSSFAQAACEKIMVTTHNCTLCHSDREDLRSSTNDNFFALAGFEDRLGKAPMGKQEETDYARK